jgi:hypothetical protein
MSYILTSICGIMIGIDARAACPTGQAGFAQKVRIESKTV